MIDIFINDYILQSNASGIIVPSLYLNEISDDWSVINEQILTSFDRHSIDLPKYFTLCVDVDILRNEDNTHALLEQIEDYPVDGFYIISIHPNNDYLVDDITWLINLIDLVAGLKLLGKKVIIGYSNHQFLSFAISKVDAICAGIWLKTRMFPLGDFDEEDDESGYGKRTTWYYCPQSLSEYQVPFLDVASRAGILGELETPSSYGSSYASVLFSGAQPTTVDFSETIAFRHYLQCLKVQCEESVKDSFDGTKEYLHLIFETASDLTDYFRSNGVRGKKREFSNISDANIALVDGFDAIRGLIYKNDWDSI